MICGLGKLLGGALRIDGNGILRRGRTIKRLYGCQSVLRDVFGSVTGNEIDAHNAVRHIGKGDFGIVYDRLSVADFKFEHPARLDIVCAVVFGNGGYVCIGKGTVLIHEDDVAHILRGVVFGERVSDLVLCHADSRRKSDAHKHHEHDGHETGRMSYEHASERL